MMKDPGFEFEYFLRYEFPKLLNLSRSKRVAMDLKFTRIRDYAQPLAEEAPEEFEAFFGEIKKIAKKVQVFRAPRGYKVIPWWNKETDEMRYRLGKTIPTHKE